MKQATSSRVFDSLFRRVDREENPWLRLVMCCVIVFVCAGPSIFLSRAADAPPEIVLTAVLGVACAYFMVSGADWWKSLMNVTFARRSVRIAIGLRLAVSIAFPVGMFIDMIIGMISMACCGVALMPEVPSDKMNPTKALLVTLIDASIQHVLVAAVAMVVFAWQRTFLTPPPPEGHCTICGYDLRASPIRCPECGTAVPAPPSCAPAESGP